MLLKSLDYTRHNYLAQSIDSDKVEKAWYRQNQAGVSMIHQKGISLELFPPPDKYKIIFIIYLLFKVFIYFFTYSPISCNSTVIEMKMFAFRGEAGPGVSFFQGLSYSGNIHYSLSL